MGNSIPSIIRESCGTGERSKIASRRLIRYIHRRNFDMPYGYFQKLSISQILKNETLTGVMFQKRVVLKNRVFRSTLILDMAIDKPYI